jgi:TonB family protein
LFTASLPAATLPSWIGLTDKRPSGVSFAHLQDLDSKDETGETPLIQATRDDDTKRLQALLQQGANPNLQDKFGWTALTYAVAGMDSSIVLLLLDHGADPNIKDHKGKTILMWAALGGKTEIIQSLIARGAEIDTATTNGATALSLAEAMKHRKAAHFLKQAGAAAGPQITKAEVPKWLAPIDEPPRMTNRPMPSYTEEARSRRIQGIVHLRVLFGIDGKIKQIKVTRGLPYGLSERAVLAAQKLKADPAKDNGQPIEHWLPVEVEFRLR